MPTKINVIIKIKILKIVEESSLSKGSQLLYQDQNLDRLPAGSPYEQCKELCHSFHGLLSPHQASSRQQTKILATSRWNQGLRLYRHRKTQVPASSLRLQHQRQKHL